MSRCLLLLVQGARLDNINIVEVISTANEFTIVVGDHDIHRAFTILMEAKRNVQN